MGIVKLSDRMKFFNPYQDYFTSSVPQLTFDTYEPLFNYSFGSTYPVPDFSFYQSPILPFLNYNQVKSQDDGSVFGFLLKRQHKPLSTSISAPMPTLSAALKLDPPNLTLNNKKNIFTTSKSGSYSPLNLSDKQLTAYGFNTREKQDAFRHLTPEMQHAVVKLTDYANSQGIKITYNSKRSIFRTYAEQAQIYRTARPGYAARPGQSRHESGEAIDIKIPGANANNKNDPKYKKLAAYWQSMGYTWGGNWRHCEPWHFDLRRSA